MRDLRTSEGSNALFRLRAARAELTGPWLFCLRVPGSRVRVTVVVDRYRDRHYCVHAYRSMCLLVLLYTTAYLNLDTLEEVSHMFIAIEENLELQFPFFQLVCVFPVAETILTQAVDGVIDFIDCSRCGLPA